MSEEEPFDLRYARSVVRSELAPGEDVDAVLAWGVYLGERRAALLGRSPIQSDLEFALSVFCWWPFKTLPPESTRGDLILVRQTALRQSEGDPSRVLDELVPESTLTADLPELERLQGQGVPSFLPAWRTYGEAERIASMYAAAIDQGTTSTRFMVFDHGGQVVSVDQKEHEQIFPKPGWVEHDPMEIWQRTQEVIHAGLDKVKASDIAAVGVTNQRETTVVWDRTTGQPVYNAIVWQDTRTDEICNELMADGGQDRFRAKTGLPIATYFSGPKIKWILENVDGIREKAKAGDVIFGNIDSWVIWQLTGGTDGGVHVTDVTNASRTMMMSLETLDWDDEILGILGVPRAMLPEIKASSEVYGQAKGDLDGISVAGDLGDQQAALFGQTCFSVGEAKNTYGTGNFLLLNTGNEIVQSKSGLLTTLAYKIGDQPATYCLEGAIAITGALVQWLRDNLGLISSAPEVEDLAKTVDDNGGVYFVPAFSGLFAPYWRSEARGVIAGLTRFNTKGHIARAALEATAWQTKEVVDAMNADSGVDLTSLRVDGGMVYNELLMQFQADVLGVPVIRPTVAETTSLGAAYAAGLAVGFWSEVEDLRANWGIDKEWQPHMDPQERDKEYAYWKKAVTRTFDWLEAPGSRFLSRRLD
jgi:glycerol kinase